jgi:Uncharacterized protein conserved in bacteria
MFRLRVRFCRGEELKFISHLDIIRLWVRALRRAGIPLEYTEGFSPIPGFHWRYRCLWGLPLKMN